MLPRLIERVVNVVFKIFVNSSILTAYTWHQLVKHHQLFLWDLVDHLMHMVIRFNKMWNDDIMGIVFLSVGKQFFKEVKVIVVDIKIYSNVFSQCLDKRIVNDLFMCTKFIEQQKYFKGTPKTSANDVISFTRHRAYNPNLFEVLVAFLCRIPGNVQFIAELVYRGQQVILFKLTGLNGPQNRIGQLQVFWCRGIFIYMDIVKKLQWLHAYNSALRFMLKLAKIKTKPFPQHNILAQ
ncbi:hypothetical protein D3C87_1396340 [compost metagenome]